MYMKESRYKRITWQIPGLALIQISFSNSTCTEVAIHHLLRKITGYNLLIRGVKSKAWRQIDEVLSFVYHDCLFHMNKLAT